VKPQTSKEAPAKVLKPVCPADRILVLPISCIHVCFYWILFWQWNLKVKVISGYIFFKASAW